MSDVNPYDLDQMAKTRKRGDCENIALHYSDKCNRLQAELQTAKEEKERLKKAMKEAIEEMEDSFIRDILEQALKETGGVAET